MNRVECKYESIGLFDNLVTISVDDGDSIVEKEIKGTAASVAYIEGFIKAFTLVNPNIEIINLGEVK